MNVGKAISAFFAVVSIAAALVAIFHFYSKGKEPQKKLPQPGTKAEEFVGNWTNSDPGTNGLTSIKIERKLTVLRIHAWSRCNPDDCYWGYRETHVSDCDDGVMVISWKNDSEETVQEIKLLPEGVLKVIGHTRYLNIPGKPDKEEAYILEKASLG